MTDTIDQVSAALPSVSVVLCCHNSATRLPQTLRHLAAQQVPPGLQWELLVIDNASTDDTRRLVDEFSSQYPRLALRLVSEPRLGQAYARQRGMAEALCDTILFVDDDNWLAPNYVALVANTLQREPGIAALGGMSTACCEGPEPSWLSRYQGWYAVTGCADCEPELKEQSFLWTAGAAFRRQILDRVRRLDLPILLSGRRGKSLDGGEDVELSHLIRLAGGKMYRHAGLYFQHYLPAGRLTWDYLRRLHYAAGLVSVRLDVYRNGYTRSSSAWPRWLLGSWSAQMANVWFRMACHPIILCRWKGNLLEGDDKVLHLETYRGRLDALWSHRRTYRKMITQSVMANVSA